MYTWKLTICCHKADNNHKYTYNTLHFYNNQEEIIPYTYKLNQIKTRIVVFFSSYCFDRCETYVYAYMKSQAAHC